MNIRKLALELLLEYELGDKYVNLSLSSHKADNLSPKERGMLTSLLYTTVEHKLTYDYYISSLAKREIAKLDPYTHNALRIGLAQIVDISSVPDFAAVNETVKLARGAGERAFINGVLRAAVKNKDSLPLPPEEKNYKRYLSVKYSFPLATVKLFDSLYGREGCERLLLAFSQQNYTDLFVNTMKISVDDFLDKLRSFGITAKRNGSVENSVRIDGSADARRIPGFSEGEFFVQDLASTVASLALGAREGDTVVDVCSCPGDKSFASAILSSDKADIRSFDLHESKLSLIESGKGRLGLSSIKVRALDATTPDESLFGTADKVICDAPCSGLGVLSKKPDLRYKDVTALDSLYPLQYSILESSVKYLRRGGVLLYSTCTLNPRENGEIVDRFLAENGEFEACDFTVGGFSSENGRLTLLPHIHNTDGFFMCKIRKKEI